MRRLRLRLHPPPITPPAKSRITALRTIRIGWPLPEERSLNRGRPARRNLTSPALTSDPGIPACGVAQDEWRGQCVPKGIRLRIPQHVEWLGAAVAVEIAFLV